jgi:DNA-binding SARP family transcriptional activator
MTATLCLRLLGPAQVERPDQPVSALSPGQQLALLGYLATHPQPLPREHPADACWPGLPTVRGQANLTWTLHKLSSVLPGCLGADRNTVQFRRADEIWVDLYAFEALAARGDVGSLAEATALYRGAFLQGLSLDGCAGFELWLVGGAGTVATTHGARWTRARQPSYPPSLTP